MSLQISGVISKVLPLEQGTTKAGSEWQKQSFIVANKDGYEGKEQLFCFEVFGEEKVQNFNKYNKEGDSVTVDFNISTNEWQGKYFTSLQSWKVSKLEVNNPNEYDVKNPTYEKSSLPLGADDLDLPF